MALRWATQHWRALDGLFCVFKPRDCHWDVVANRISAQLARELNALPEPQRLRTRLLTPARGAGGAAPVKIAVEPDLAHSALALGPRFTVADVRLWPAEPLPFLASGVTLCGLGPWGRSLATQLERAMLLRVYRVTLRLGQQTADGTPHSSTTLRASWRKVRRHQVERLCASVEGQYQRSAFHLAGVLPNSAAAYALACQGAIRPAPLDTEAAAVLGGDTAADRPPVVYALRCVQFAPPELTLEVHCANETPDFLLKLALDMALTLRTVGHVTAVRRTRYGRATTEQALLPSEGELSLDSALASVRLCGQLHPSAELLSAATSSPSHFQRLEPATD